MSINIQMFELAVRVVIKWILTSLDCSFLVVDLNSLAKKSLSIVCWFDWVFTFIRYELNISLKVVDSADTKKNWFRDLLERICKVTWIHVGQTQWERLLYTPSSVSSSDRELIHCLRLCNLYNVSVYYTNFSIDNGITLQSKLICCNVYKSP